MAKIPNPKSQIPKCAAIGVLSGLLLSSCLDLPVKGRLGEPCFENGRCTESLKCSDGVCVDATEDAGSQAGDAGADREIVVVYPDAGQTKDTGGRPDRGAGDTDDEDAGPQDADGGEPDAGPEAADGGGKSDTGPADGASDDDGGQAPGDGGDAGPEDAGEPDTGTPDAGDPCAEFICLCDSYCKLESGLPKCFPGCANDSHCCADKTCKTGQCN